MNSQEVDQVSSALRSEHGDGEDGRFARMVGGRIRELRESKGLTMRELAPLAGLKQPFLSQLERGLSAPSLSSLYRLAKALDVSPSELMPADESVEGAIVIRSTEGRMVKSSEQANASIGRVLFPEGRLLELSEFTVTSAQNSDEWFENLGEAVTYVLDGEIDIEIEGDRVWTLGRHDALFYPSPCRSRWSNTRPKPASLLYVLAHSSDGVQEA